jgi:hypothetical protein
METFAASSVFEINDCRWVAQVSIFRAGTCLRVFLENPAFWFRCLFALG